MRENTDQKKLRIWTLFTQYVLTDEDVFLDIVRCFCVLIGEHFASLFISKLLLIFFNFLDYGKDFYGHKKFDFEAHNI